MTDATPRLTFGLFLPQGWKHDLVQVDPVDHWSVMSGLARHADEGDVWDSIWVYDHFHTVPELRLTSDGRANDAEANRPSDRRRSPGRTPNPPPYLATLA